MLKKTIKYVDYNGVERTEDFYFNLTTAEVTEMQLLANGQLTNTITSMINAQDAPALVKLFKDLIFKAYGEKSIDGRRFVKSEELSTAFSQTEAFSQLFMELAFDADKGAEFVNGILPADLQQTVNQAVRPGIQ